MATQNLFSIKINELTSLGPDRAVEAFRRLLWAEGATVGIGKHLINVPQCINEGDGGLDAFIHNANHTKDDIIPIGNSGFQIKSSDLEPTECKKELYIRGTLKQGIKDLLDNNGTYVMVLFADLTDPKLIKRKNAIINELKRIGYLNPKVRLYSANQLQGYFEKFPSLISWFNSNLLSCLPYSVWETRQEVSIPSIYVPDEERLKQTNDIRSELQNPVGCRVFRITGLSGIGKTRFIFEALSPDDLRNRVIYTHNEAFLGSQLYHYLQINEDLSAILVIDDCDIQSHRELVRAFSTKGDRFALITLSNDMEAVPYPTKHLKMAQLDEEKIKEILFYHAPVLPKLTISRLARFADGYPYIGILLADSYMSNKDNEQNFVTINDEGLINHLIGGIDTDSEHFRKTKKVLRGLSLFSKVGFEGYLSSEAEWVAENVIRIDYSEFLEIVSEQRKRGVVQGHHYISVTPFMLRVYLINDRWEINGFTKESFESFLGSIPENIGSGLLSRFFDNTPYIASTEKGKEFTKSILGSGGPFANSELLKTKLGSKFFFNLTSADPKSALHCLEMTIGKKSKDELLNFTIGRREVVDSLQKIAIWEDLFDGAAILLASLGEAENESWSNNASGIFAELFTPAPGMVASTEASPKKRFPILQSLIHSKSPEMRKLIFSACKEALKVRNFSRTMGPESQGLRKQPNLWKPSSRQEYIDYYIQVWHLLFETIEISEDNDKKAIITILLESIRELGRIPELTDVIIADITALSTKPYINRSELITKLEEFVHYNIKHLPIDTLSKWDNLSKSLMGSDFHSRLERFVGLILLTDIYDEDFNQTNKVEEEIKKLAGESINNHSILKAEFDWLTTEKAKNGYLFGYDLGLLDGDNSFLPLIISAQENTSQRKENSEFFFGGYLKAIFKKNQDQWENILDRLIENPKIVSLIPELTWRSGISDRAALRILNLAQGKQITTNKLRFFAYGSVLKELSERVVIQWIEFLLDCSEENIGSIALEITHAFFLRKDSDNVLPKDLTHRLLTHKSFVEKHIEPANKTMDEFHWKEIGKKFIELYPDSSVSLVEFVLENFGNNESFIGDNFSNSLELINKIALQNSKEVWSIVTKYLGPPIDSRAFHLKEWLRGDELYSTGRTGALSYFSLKDILEWVDQDVENRAWYIANLVPKELSKKTGRVCLAREVLVKYGDREDVQNELMANFFTDSWTGPASLQYKEIKKKLIEFLDTEENENVLKWGRKIIYSLDEHIKREEIEEEERGF